MFAFLVSLLASFGYGTSPQVAASVHAGSTGATHSSNPLVLRTPSPDGGVGLGGSGGTGVGASDGGTVP